MGNTFAQTVVVDMKLCVHGGSSIPTHQIPEATTMNPLKNPRMVALSVSIVMVLACVFAICLGI